MEVQLTPEQEAFVRAAVANGRIGGAEEAVENAMSLWVERERTRAELLRSLDEAEEDFKAGRYTEYTDETLPQLAEEIKREGRALRASRTDK